MQKLTRGKTTVIFSHKHKNWYKENNLCGLVCCCVPCLRWISICEKVPSGMWRVTQLTAASGAGRSTSASWLNPNLLNESTYAHQNNILCAQRLPVTRTLDWTYVLCGKSSKQACLPLGIFATTIFISPYSCLSYAVPLTELPLPPPPPNLPSKIKKTQISR